MIPAERQKLILTSLRERGIFSLAELVDLLGVSHMTVRRDVQKLEAEGKLNTVAGGISLPERISFEPSHVKKAQTAQAEKLAIGACAANMVPPSSVVYLDAGTTVLEIARKLAPRDDLTIVTNDFVIAGLLSAESRCKLIHTGGLVERENQSGVGEIAAHTITGFNFDIAFTSTSSFGLRGVSTPTEVKVTVKRAIMRSAARNVLVTDSSKYGLVAAYNAVPLDALTDLVTDSGLPDSARSAIANKGVTLHIVNIHDQGSTT
ncbi:DeoR/GlpR family DNA-binding transcription regulator [Ochrobactrum sp. SFR4]|uniref:DeoR/GlpR family DNA-binding transcription regulator n=1 Tax=Ochrobactrum sp. SFR4 TaxID=2717368 RepID=UPI000EFC19C7|nr:DeoR/GlpR family DNA-binding transcription regulator [Ochrobactrum sp. SFR4]MBX8827403.1 DeoR/GlpR transcriptional regulator [Ochrobactrum sp. SFR4]